MTILNSPTFIFYCINSVLHLSVEKKNPSSTRIGSFQEVGVDLID